VEGRETVKFTIDTKYKATMIIVLIV